MKKLFITEEQKFMVEHLLTNGSNVLLLNEENRTQKKKCEEHITNNCPGYIRQYLNTPVVDLPNDIKGILNPEGQLYKQTARAPEGVNKLIDYLRHNLYSQFGIKRNTTLVQYIPGVARIACKDLHYYSFSYSIRGGEIIKMTRLMKLIDKKPDLMLSDITLDSDFNGMSYDEMMALFAPKMEEYRNGVHNNLNGEDYKVVNTSEYTIVEVPDRLVAGYGGYVLKPTQEGRRLLNKLGRYTDWCICSHSHADEEYAQYLSNGGKAYICMKHGFENIPRPENVETAIDEYGVSLICVIVGQDGLPDNVTTRYNHDFDGENHGDLWEATHLQKLLQVNYLDVFHPRGIEELRRMHMAESKVLTPQEQVGGKVNAGIMDGLACCEGAEPESDSYTIGGEGGNNEYFHVVNESKDRENYLNKKAKSIAEFMKESGLNVYPFPEIEFNNDEQKGLFITTGYYLPDEKKVVLFCKNRHPKDILRSYAHELIHHMQNLDGKNLHFSSADDVKDNKELEELESEAYLKGNIYFRKWTEYERKKKKNTLNESLLKESPDSIEIAGINYEDECAFPFLLFKGFPNEPIFGIEGSTHGDLCGDFGEYYEEYDVSDELKAAINNKTIRPILSQSYELQGRYFGEVDLPWAGNIISVYDYNQNNLSDIGRKLYPVLKNLPKWGINVNIKDVDFDDWIGPQSFRYPFSWLLNGMAQTIVGSAYSIQRDKSNERRYTFIGKNGTVLKFDAEGTVLNSEKASLREALLHEFLQPDNVDLSSFKVQNNLNPKFWKDNKLDSRIRIKLLDIADDFIEFLGVDWVKPKDIFITGSLSNFNWSKKYSDIDLHILMDFSKVDKRVDFVKKYFKAQKDIWNDKHDGLRIYGFPIEVYVQDVHETHNSGGIYSLEKNEWVVEPEKEKLSLNSTNQDKVKKEVSKYTKKIEALEKRSKTMKGDEYKSRKVMEDAQKLFDELKRKRSKGLSKRNSELSDENLIFKCLRRLGYLDRLCNIIDNGYDAFNSLM